MKAIKFPEVNSNMTGEDCYDLPVYKFHQGQNLYFISKWMPSEADKLAIIEGRGIYLQIVGGQPPVAVYTINENGEPNEIEIEEKKLI